MGINVKTVYKLDPKNKEIIAAYLHGEITQSEAARAFGVKRQNFATIVTGIFRHMVATKAIDITNALKTY